MDIRKILLIPIVLYALFFEFIHFIFGVLNQSRSSYTKFNEAMSILFPAIFVVLIWSIRFIIKMHDGTNNVQSTSHRNHCKRMHVYNVIMCIIGTTALCSQIYFFVPYLYLHKISSYTYYESVIPFAVSCLICFY